MKEQLLTREPLKPGNIYRFLGYSRGIKIQYVMLPGHPDYDGALPGVSVGFLKNERSRGTRGFFYVCKSEEEFWAYDCFENCYDPQTENKKLDSLLTLVVGV